MAVNRTPSRKEALIWFGNERVATGITTENRILRKLLSDGYNVAAIVVNNHTKEGTRKVRDLEINSIAKQHNIPLLAPEKPADIAQQLFNYNAQAAILVAYGKIIPQSVIDIFPSGIINIHPSLLPKHRGPTPLESVMLSGDTKTGVSVMSLVKEMDAGPVYAQSEITLEGTESKQELADRLSDVAAAMLSEVLPGILAGDIVAAPQDDTTASYDMLVDKRAGLVDWTKSAVQLEREVRAYYGWPKSRVTLGTIDVVITEAHVVQGANAAPGTIVVSSNPSTLQVQCGKDSLQIDLLKPAGKKDMTAAEFLRGYGARIITDKN